MDIEPRSKAMYAFMGTTGRVGGGAAQRMKQQGVRAIVRDASKAPKWAEAATADVLDTHALTRAFEGMAGVFVMVPPNWAPSPGFPEAHAVVRSIASAVGQAKPGKVVMLSSIGAQRSEGLGLITPLHLLESALDELDVPHAHLRAGWFMENAAWDVPSARQGVIESYLGPLDREVPMVATDDIAAVVAELLQERWQGRRVVELGRPTSPNQLAEGFARALGRPVAARTVPRDSWEARFQAEGTAWPAPRLEMLDGFNSGWIAFESELRASPTSFDEVARTLV